MTFTTHILLLHNCLIDYIILSILDNLILNLKELYCDLESAAAGTVGQRAAWPHKNY